MQAGWPERVVRLLATLLLVTFLTSMMFDLLPGDPALAVIGGDTFNVTPERIEQTRRELNLDEPVPLRYVKWLGNAVQGDLGKSYATRQQVMDAITERLPTTLQLLVMAQIFAITFTLVVAPIAARKPGRTFDKASTTLSFGSAGDTHVHRRVAAALHLRGAARLATRDRLRASQRLGVAEHPVADPAGDDARRTGGRRLHAAAALGDGAHDA